MCIKIFCSFSCFVNKISFKMKIWRDFQWVSLIIFWNAKVNPFETDWHHAPKLRQLLAKIMYLHAKRVIYFNFFPFGRVEQWRLWRNLFQNVKAQGNQKDSDYSFKVQTFENIYNQKNVSKYKNCFRNQPGFYLEFSQQRRIHLFPSKSKNIESLS